MNSDFSRGRPYGPYGCQVPIGKGICGEKRTLDIINQFKRLYQKKMEEIDTAGGGDCLMVTLHPYRFCWVWFTLDILLS